ncbi:PadR family transcriptional regulator [Vallicoccus soli]|uniref:PadR family transcriptional regulator n=1 Tax=Vallicoccus soli TaxID=2339232 RepID=A0A3A3ZHH9_9ACTN|nr:PadR family transcriptional regulator [Vallicoccus soli]RJK94780.1 PadR family transcriptional regulator [Vallicoccus soli]
MSRGALTTTSYAVLGLLAVRPWSTYELTRQMGRSVGLVWPRAQSKLYEEPKKLVAHGLATGARELVGRRPRTVYAITPQGREALAEWLREPGAGPVLEAEQLLHVLFSENGTREDLLATLAAARAWARERAAESAAVGQQYLDGTGPFPERLPQLLLVSRFLTDYYALVEQWAAWAGEVVPGWPQDVAAATADRAVLEDVVARARRAAGQEP